MSKCHKCWKAFRNTFVVYIRAKSPSSSSNAFFPPFLFLNSRNQKADFLSLPLTQALHQQFGAVAVFSNLKSGKQNSMVFSFLLFTTHLLVFHGFVFYFLLNILYFAFFFIFFLNFLFSFLGFNNFSFSCWEIHWKIWKAQSTATRTSKNFHLPTKLSMALQLSTSESGY